jgi:hypothetical protein
MAKTCYKKWGIYAPKNVHCKSIADFHKSGIKTFKPPFIITFACMGSGGEFA